MVAKKVDANQGEIVKALRRVGAKVQPLHIVGKGCPDIAVAFRGAWFMAELKDGSKPPSAQRLTPDEAEWHAAFSQQAPVHVWRDADEALRCIGAIS